MEVQVGIGAILVGIAVFAAIIWGIVRMQKAAQARVARSLREMNARMEALFATGFPELQPHFHPKNVYEFAKARQARKASSGPARWRNPDGFTLATFADIQPDGLKDKVRLLDAKGSELAAFGFEEHAEGAVLRVGKGKFTVGLKSTEPRVRYWHPEREFKWTPSSWNLKSGLAEQPLRSRPRGSIGSGDPDYDDDRYHDHDTDGSSSAARAATGAAAGAGAVAAASAMGAGDSAPDFSGVESGSSSTATTY